MPMGGDGEVSERARVGDDSDFLRGLELIAEHVVARPRKGAPHGKMGPRGVELPEALRGGIAEEPPGLLVALAGLAAKLRAAEEHRAGREERSIDSGPRAGICGAGRRQA